ncbi:hypothetical protein, partial [Ralstonia solanacearum]|uniref:hypothetical protein n=1 Tax=Ralstonia solanacearum TaxID=305 RepID=UPI0018C271CB
MTPTYAVGVVVSGCCDWPEGFASACSFRLHVAIHDVLVGQVGSFELLPTSISAPCGLCGST